VGTNRAANSQGLVNPAWRLTPNLSLNQAAYNVRVAGNAAASVPPWLYGYNPYPQAVNYGPVYGPLATTTSPYAGGLSPYGGASLTSVSPYTPYTGGATMTSVSPGGSPGYDTGGTTPYNNPYYSPYEYGTPDPLSGPGRVDSGRM
jgi:hypothetical protein